MGKQKSELDKKFDAFFNVREHEIFAQHHHTEKARQVKHPKGYFERRFIGVVKWFDVDKGKDGLGYVVTNDFGFEKWDKRGSDFVELSFTKKCCRDGIVPRERGVVVFRMGVVEGRRCVVELRSAQFIADDFKLALTYNAKRYPIISGTSNKSNWRCHVHVLSALLHCVSPTEENLIKVKDWINLYLSCLSDTDRNVVIEAWRSDVWFSRRLAIWIPGLSSSLTSCPRHENTGEADEIKEAVFELNNESVKRDMSCGAIDGCIQSERSNVEMSVVPHPKGYARAHEKLTNRMYIANVGKRLRSLNNPSPIDCKRWVWELLQNAKDTVGEGNKLVDAYFKV